MDDQHVGRVGDLGPRIEVIVGIVRDLCVSPGLIMKLELATRMVTVRRRARGERGAEVAAAARVVLDVELLAEIFGELLHQQAGYRIGPVLRAAANGTITRTGRLG